MLLCAFFQEGIWVAFFALFERLFLSGSSGYSLFVGPFIHLLFLMGSWGLLVSFFPLPFPLLHVPFVCGVNLISHTQDHNAN